MSAYDSSFREMADFRFRMADGRPLKKFCSVSWTLFPSKTFHYSICF